MNELHLFAGAGGGILGGILLGHTCVCAVELEPYCRKVLLQRQRDGMLPRFPIWDDVRTFDGKPWFGAVDVVCGGFPCQDISWNGKGAGLDGKSSGLWREMARIIGEVRPNYVLVENSPALVFRGGLRVLSDLAGMGYDARWGVVGAYHAGAAHIRKRLWIHSYTPSNRRTRWWDAESQFPLQLERLASREWIAPSTAREKCRFLGLPTNAADRGKRIRALGNMQVPAVVKLAWQTLNSIE